MKSGGPWNLRGLRPDARAAARDAARRSGMSVGEWLNTVIEPTEAEDDETWRSNDAEERSADRSVRRSREEFRDREARRQQEPPHRREYVSDEPRRKSPQDDNDRMIEQDRDRMPRHRDREPDERQWRARTGESEQHSRHRNRKDRFRDREADEFAAAIRSGWRRVVRTSSRSPRTTAPMGGGRRTRMASARPGSRVPTPRRSAAPLSRPRLRR